MMESPSGSRERAHSWPWCCLPGRLLPPVCPPGSREVGRPSMPIWPWLTGDEVTPNSPYPLIAPDGLAK
ncbi:hypothetical protein CesoFtcFv8_011327 [Champsocephalus esox]|uniref:Uncharacterized protein n=1 Tax=Champsocephalus esox TaxID=159716 RepID=A0AAN8H0B6_9TELE|nr:hypothetical protein CesoFtcFv8_011327 [Champsocephalus esox]